jgi:hypothetical protein
VRSTTTESGSLSGVLLLPHSFSCLLSPPHSFPLSLSVPSFTGADNTPARQRQTTDTTRSHITLSCWKNGTPMNSPCLATRPAGWLFRRRRTPRHDARRLLLCSWSAAPVAGAARRNGLIGCISLLEVTFGYLCTCALRAYSLVML